MHPIQIESMSSPSILVYGGKEKPLDDPKTLGSSKACMSFIKPNPYPKVTGINS
jgi:hypothetical protein